jgi:copper(I)-binding protein
MGGITVHKAWIRPAAESFNTALYCTIINNSEQADTLYKISSNISDDIQMHETYMKDDLIGMRPVNNFVVAPHDSVVLKPGGYHIMLMNLKENAADKSTKDITLFFKKSGKVQIKAEVNTPH